MSVFGEKWWLTAILKLKGSTMERMTTPCNLRTIILFKTNIDKLDKMVSRQKMDQLHKL